MTKEEWIKWEPIKGLAPKYYIESISDCFKELKIILCDSDDKRKKVKIRFEGPIDSYTRTDKSFSLNTINFLNEKYGPEFYGKWTFFKVTGSKYLQWISEQSYEIYKANDFTHFSFITENSIIDVIDSWSPKVEHLK